MRSIFTIIIATTITLTTSIALAEDRHGHGPYDNWSWRDRQHQNYHRHGHDRHYVEREVITTYRSRPLRRYVLPRSRTIVIERRDNTGAAFAAGIAGGVIGSLLTNSLQQSAPEPYYPPVTEQLPAPQFGSTQDDRRSAFTEPLSNNPCWPQQPIRHIYTGEIRGCR